MKPKDIVAQTITADVVRAQAFDLVDAAGDVRGSLCLNDQGAAGLFLFDPKTGTTRVQVRLGAEGPAIILAHPNGETAVTVAVKEDGIWTGVWDRAGNIRLCAGLHKDHEVVLEVPKTDAEEWFDKQRLGGEGGR